MTDKTNLPPLAMREDRTIEQRIADGDACGERFLSLSDGIERMCYLPPGHWCAHAWEVVP
jgi:hypothetical protein